jgi:Derlin-2/3
MQRYARMLEETAASVAHFSWLMAGISLTLLTVAPLFSQAFLGTTLSSTLVYIWARKNPDTRLSFLGLLTFKAPWLPWVLVAFNVVLHGHWPKDELCGIAVGHGESWDEISPRKTSGTRAKQRSRVAVWYFFGEIYPSTHSGHRPLDPPQWWCNLFERNPAPPAGSEVHPAALNLDMAAPAVDVQ